MYGDFLYKSNRPLEEDTKIQDAATPVNSAGSPTQPYGNATGEFNLHTSLSRKVKSRKDSGQPKFNEDSDDDANKRYFGSFSLEAKRNVMDLLQNHPMFDDQNGIRKNRVQNNTRDVMKNDPTKTVEIGGSIHYQNAPQASQPNY
jgi:hypothetical protein